MKNKKAGRKTTNLKAVLALIENKYGEGAALIIFPDQSGRIVKSQNVATPYDKEPLYNIHRLDDLMDHLLEEDK